MDELQSLIDLALSDGRISDGEMNLIRGKALALGVDDKTLFQLIDVRKGLIKHDSSASIARCPNCKEPVKELATQCAWCGHSLTKVMDRESITSFHQRILAANPSDRAVLISSYPLPVVKQEIIEFLSIAVPASRQMTVQERNAFVVKGNVGFGNAVYSDALHHAEAEARAWGIKAGAIINNACFLHSQDQEFVAAVRAYEKELDNNVNRRSHEEARVQRSAMKGLAAAFGFMLLLVLFAAIMSFLE